LGKAEKGEEGTKTAQHREADKKSKEQSQLTESKDEDEPTERFARKRSNFG
jgi:hypothetical protein